MKQFTKAQKDHIALVKSLVKKGDLLTHTRCMGALEEHIFTGYSGKWMCGKPTKMTKKYGSCVGIYADDIHPLSITHINRDTPDTIILLDELKGEQE